MKFSPLVGAGAVSLLLPVFAQAGFNADPSIFATLATGTPGQRLQSVSVGNPAATTFLIDEDENLRMALLNHISINSEISDLGWVDGKYLSINECIFGDTEDCTAPFDNLLEDQDDIAAYLDMIRDLETDFNRLADDGYVMGRSSASVPLFPIAIRLPNQGVITFDANAYLEARASILRGEIVPNADGDIQTNSAGYTKEAAIAQYSIGYSQAVAEFAQGTLFAGGRVNAGYAALAKQVVGLTADEPGIGEQQLEDSLNHGLLLGADLGLTFFAPRYTTGFTVKNINEPSLDYGELGVNCQSYEDNSVDQSNCYFAASHGDQIDLSETHTRHRQYTFDGTLYTRSKHASLSTIVDINPVYSFTGELEQYAGVGATYYNPNWYLLTGARAGYSQNLTGRGLGYATAGLTLFGGVDLDLTLAELASFEDLLAPRGFSIALGINEKF